MRRWRRCVVGAAAGEVQVSAVVPFSACHGSVQSIPEQDASKWREHFTFAPPFAVRTSPVVSERIDSLANCRRFLFFFMRSHAPYRTTGNRGGCRMAVVGSVWECLASDAWVIGIHQRP